MMLDCGREACEEHGDLCAYHGDEEGRCSWCHESWLSIIGGGHHTCERVKLWTPRERSWRVTFAKQARIRALIAIETDEMGDPDPHCSHVTKEPPTRLNPVCHRYEGETNG